MIELMAIDPNKAWTLFMSDPADFVLMFAAVAAAAFWFAWWLRSHIVKERLELLRSQRDDLDKKLKAADSSLATLRTQISNKGGDTELLTATYSARAIFGDMQIISDNMRVTLTPTSGPFRIVVPLRKIDEP